MPVVVGWRRGLADLVLAALSAVALGYLSHRTVVHQVERVVEQTVALGRWMERARDAGNL